MVFSTVFGIRCMQWPDDRWKDSFAEAEGLYFTGRKTYKVQIQGTDTRHIYKVHLQAIHYLQAQLSCFYGSDISTRSGPNNDQIEII